MPGPRHDDMTPEPPQPFTCPACKATSHHPDDLRYGYCGRCKDFTGEPTDFVIHGDPAFGERVSEMVRHRFETGAYGSQPILLTDEEREEMWARNLAEFRAHERVALTIRRPEFDAFTVRVLASSRRARIGYAIGTVRGWFARLLRLR